ncbi:hypothetical protein [Nocardioides litoris]|uniref:hypothetical protein n=1 Tax=Nocardioides litoris TaxID=1926648 RepID=UPI0011219CC2|nr:hypothetical protein [Nocardioides litoris]
MEWRTTARESTNRALPLVEARQLARRNESNHQQLERNRVKAQGLFQSARDDLDQSFGSAFDDFLAPFASQFAKLKNVDLGELRVLEEVPELAELDVAMRQVAVSAVRGLTSLAGGTAAGASAGALTFSAVGAFAAASTGTAISSLSGAAATSATLAWLGGGSLAAGGGGVAVGTTVLAGVVAAPVLLAAGGFLYWQGRKSLQAQRELALELERAEAQLTVDCMRVRLASTRYVDAARVLRELVRVGSSRLPALGALVDRSTDFATYSRDERAAVAELAGLAQAAAAVVACPLVDEHGTVTEVGHTTLAAAEAAAVAQAR